LFDKNLLKEILFLFGSAGVSTQGLLAGQVLYHRSHASGPFALVILELGSQFFAQDSLDCNPPVYAFPYSRDDRFMPLYPSID
jgi:hypothetical protein